MAYGYVTFAQLQAALLQRLQDTGGVFTTTAEAGLYLIEALRVLNAQAAIWNQDWTITFTSASTWVTVNQVGSPRIRTVTDTSLYTEMEYQLLEPPTGGTWTGTSQFNITNLSEALQYRRDELLKMSGANMVNLTTLNSPNAGVTTVLPDTILDLRRVRWIPVTTPPNPYTPYALWREDITSANAYGDTLVLQSVNPESWMITSNTPLEFSVSSTPLLPGNWDLLALESGAPLAPPATTVMGLPDDWCWVAKYGALADIMSNAPEATDDLRMKYCVDRYTRGMKAMMNLPWLLTASVANLPVDTPSFEEADAYAQNWENNWPSSDPQIVVGGMDLVALAPFVGGSGGSGWGDGGWGGGGWGGGGGGATVEGVLTMVGNAPIPSSGSSEIQLSRDAVDAVLAYAHHIAMFKRGGAEFAETLPLLKQFEDYCASVNANYRALGIFRTDMILSGNRSTDLDPRFEKELVKK